MEAARLKSMVSASEGLRQENDNIAISADAIARAIAFAVEQPADVDVSEIIVRPISEWLAETPRSMTRKSQFERLMALPNPA
jgi:hypothetical protein